MDCEFKNYDLASTIKNFRSKRVEQQNAKLDQQKQACPLSLHDILGPKPFVTPVGNTVSLKSMLNEIQNKNKLTYNMGNGKIDHRDPEVIANEIMNKEYPDIYNSKSPTFIPEFFIPGNPLLYNDLTKEHRQILKNQRNPSSTKSSNTTVTRLAKDFNETDDQLGCGDMAEWHIYNQLKRTIYSFFSRKRDLGGSNIRIEEDVIVLHGLHMAQKKLIGNINHLEIGEQEYDFVIFSPSRKLIIPLEAKTTLTLANHSKASVQLQKNRNFFQNYLHDLLDDDFQFCASVYFHNKNNQKICTTKCDKWTIYDEKDFEPWWEEVKRNFPVKNPNEQKRAREQILKVVSFLLFIIHFKMPTTPGKSIEKISDLMKEVGSPDNIVFWNPGQLDLMEYRKHNFVCFDSGPGTGKSILMQTKCEQEAQAGRKCLYITGGIIPTTQYTLLHRQLRERWKSQPNIQLMSFYELLVRTKYLVIIFYISSC